MYLTQHAIQSFSLSVSELSIRVWEGRLFQLQAIPPGGTANFLYGGQQILMHTHTVGRMRD
jgi:hypothetical protein